MKAVCYSAAQQFDVITTDLGDLHEGHVRLRVLASGVCGTDAHIHRGGFGVRFPMIPGHEFIGEIVDANVNGPAPVHLGERVAVDNVITCGTCSMCRDGRRGLCADLAAYGLTHAGGAAEYVDVPAAVCASIGEMPIETAVLAEPTACVVHGLDVLQPKAGHDVLIIGAGPTGQILAQLLGSSGASRVTVAAPTEPKLEVARHHGAQETVTIRKGEFEASVATLRSLTPEGFDVVVDATGAGNVLEHCLPLVRDGGTLMVYGMAEESTTIPISPYEIFRRELTIKGAFSQTNCVVRATKLLKAGRISGDGIITHKFSLDQYGEALDALRDSECLKAVVLP